MALTKKIDLPHPGGFRGLYIDVCGMCDDVCLFVGGWVSATPHLLISGTCYVGPYRPYLQIYPNEL